MRFSTKDSHKLRGFETVIQYCKLSQCVMEVALYICRDLGMASTYRCVLISSLILLLKLTVS